MLPAQITIFRAYISGKISEQLGYKFDAHILTPVIHDISHIITQYLGSKALANLAIAISLPSLKDEAQNKIKQEAELKRQQAEAEQKRIEQERKAEQERLKAELKRNEDRLEKEFIKLWELEQKSLQQSRINQKRQTTNLFKGIGAGVIASYATYKLATTFCDAYISDNAAMGVSIIAGGAISYVAYTRLERQAVAATVA
jgi:hypothetical protein